MLHRVELARLGLDLNLPPALIVPVNSNRVAKNYWGLQTLICCHSLSFSIDIYLSRSHIHRITTNTFSISLQISLPSKNFKLGTYFIRVGHKVLFLQMLSSFFMLIHHRQDLNPKPPNKCILTTYLIRSRSRLVICESCSLLMSVTTI